MPRKKKIAAEPVVNASEPEIGGGASVAVAEPAPVTSAPAAVEVPLPAELPPPVVAEGPQTVAPPAAKSPPPQPGDLPKPMKPVPTPPVPSNQAGGWANPYIPLFVCEEKGFEMGEHHRYKQRVFLFNEKPADQIRATLKEHGFIYRPEEKAWTIPATAENRILSDQLAREFAGQDRGMSR